MADPLLALDDLLSNGGSAPPTVHALTATTLVGDSTGFPITLKRGDEVTATPELRRLNTGRTGQCSLDRSDLFAPGPAPADVLPTEGSPEWSDVHRARHAVAWRIEDRAEREAELRRVRAQFGSLNPSRTLRATP